MRKYLLVLLLTLVSPLLSAKNYSVKLGDNRLIIQKLYGKGVTYVHLHRSENTALQAACSTRKARGGSLITLLPSGGRNICFRLHKKYYRFDPNRIFTERGIKKTLQKNSHYTPAAAREVRKLARKIKLLLPRGKIIAVHNNKLYSLKDYFRGKPLAGDVKALYYNPRKSFRNFFLVTRQKDFRRFKRAGFNTVWQKPNPQDDGSLSVYLARRHYINVEAGYNQLTEQKKMLRIAS